MQILPARVGYWQEIAVLSFELRIVEITFLAGGKSCRPPYFGLCG